MASVDKGPGKWGVHILPAGVVSGACLASLKPGNVAQPKVRKEAVKATYESIDMNEPVADVSFDDWSKVVDEGKLIWGGGGRLIALPRALLLEAGSLRGTGK